MRHFMRRSLAFVAVALITLAGPAHATVSGADFPVVAVGGALWLVASNGDVYDVSAGVAGLTPCVNVFAATGVSPLGPIVGVSQNSFNQYSLCDAGGNLFDQISNLCGFTAAGNLFTGTGITPEPIARYANFTGAEMFVTASGNLYVKNAGTWTKVGLLGGSTTPTVSRSWGSLKLRYR